MTELDTLLQTAAQRAQQQGLPYAGLLLPTEAAALLAEPDAQAVLVDVRSAAEWQFVGQVPHAVHIEYKSFPGMVLNPNFISSLKAQVPPQKKCYFCAVLVHVRTTPLVLLRQRVTPRLIS